MINWLKCVNCEISKTSHLNTAITDVGSIQNPEMAGYGTVITDKRNLMAVMAVTKLAKSEISTCSNGSTGVPYLS